MADIEFSFVVPVFNSEATLEELFSRIRHTMETAGRPFEVVFVDDGSGDSSWEVLSRIKEASPGRVTAVRLAKNFGQHNATFCGFSFVRGRWVITLDDDLQHPPEEIPKLIAAREGSDADLVYGIYTKKEHSAVRNLGSKTLKRSSRIFGRPGEGSSFRLIDKAVVEKMLVHHQNFVFLDEILHWYTDSIAYARVRHDRRKVKKSGYTPRKIWSMMANIMVYYTAVPLKIMVYGGLASSVFFFILSLYFVAKKILLNVPLGYTSLIVAILFSTSLILLCLGIIGEYLSRIYLVQNKKPPYSVKKVL
jgi:glycosyltransferase involved in cell wall biosynthesis